MSAKGRPKGMKNAKPSREAIQSYYRLLSTAAEDGDTNAAGWLVFISEKRKPEPHMPAGATEEGKAHD